MTDLINIRDWDTFERTWAATSIIAELRALDAITIEDVATAVLDQLFGAEPGNRPDPVNRERFIAAQKVRRAIDGWGALAAARTEVPGEGA